MSGDNGGPKKVRGEVVMQIRGEAEWVYFRIAGRPGGIDPPLEVCRARRSVLEQDEAFREAFMALWDLWFKKLVTDKAREVGIEGPIEVHHEKPTKPKKRRRSGGHWMGRGLK